MTFRLLALLMAIFASSAHAQDIKSIHPILDVYVVKYQRNLDHDFWHGGSTSLGDRPSPQQILSWLVKETSFFKARYGENTQPYKIVTDYSGRFFSLYTNDPSIETKRYFDSKSWKEDSAYVSSQHNQGKNLYACSSMRDFRLYAFKKGSPEIFLWEDFNLSKGRTYFHRELESFNSNGRYFLTPDGRKWDVWGLPRGDKYRVRDIDQCHYQGTWVAILNNSPAYQGKAFTFQSRDLAVLWDQVKKYRKQGVHLVDIEKGEVRETGKPLWYGVFSSSKALKQDIEIKVYKNYDEFWNDNAKMMSNGFSVVDIEISSRGSI